MVETPFQRFVSDFCESKLSVVSFYVVLAILFIAIFAPWLAPTDPYDLSTVTVKDSFGRLWYFAHMHHSPAPVVSAGQHVNKGQRIGTVGTSAHAVGTPPHLHLDMRVGVDSRVSCSGSGCSGYGFVNNQPLLRTAFLQIS